jgi:hypothetical protein
MAEATTALAGGGARSTQGDCVLNDDLENHLRQANLGGFQ